MIVSICSTGLGGAYDLNSAALAAGLARLVLALAAETAEPEALAFAFLLLDGGSSSGSHSSSPGRSASVTGSNQSSSSSKPEQLSMGQWSMAGTVDSVCLRTVVADVEEVVAVLERLLLGDADLALVRRHGLAELQGQTTARRRRTSVQGWARRLG